MNHLRGAVPGYSLLELVVVLTLLGVALGLAAPAMGGVVRRARMQATMDGLSRDLFHARMLAVRSGRQVEIHFTYQAAPCVDGYRIVVREGDGYEAKRVMVAGSAGGLCLRKNGSDILAFSSRGRPNWNLSFWIRHGEMLDSLTLNQLGRLNRWY